MWHDDHDLLDRWHDAARKRAVSVGILRDDNRPEDVYEDTPYMTLYAQFVEVNGSVSQYASGNIAYAAFSDFLDVPEVLPSLQGQVYEASITKQYGGITATFGYSAVFDIRPDQARGAYKYCVDMVNKQFEVYEKTGLHTSKPPVQPQQSGEDTVEFFGDTIIVELKDEGKRYYKIKGGEYTRFGVRVWPEVLKQFGVDIDSLQLGENQLARTCHAIRTNGKVKKVVNIE